MSVKVGVRVRPFNKRQQQLGAKLCIQMDKTSTSLIDSDGGKKTFNYDYSFWSHDGFEVDQNGYSYPVDQKYADQKKVYELIGSDILVNAWQGYNCCLFAYGQTGSGKSYSMIGYGANKGLIPIVCNSIFDKIQSNQDGSRSYQVKVSMMQIYNQSVKDLLSKSKQKSQLKICQHKTLGVYVEGLVKHPVDSYQKIQKKIQEGSNNRSIAATLMNQSSSRSHTIVSINFVQKIQISMEQTSVKYSVIHLVDLAGSQCVAKTGATTKDRLRQTAKINQSLTTLGRVIQILADNCAKKDKDKTFVPYRDSKLTFILRNALGGNSMTAMICAISPADDNYQQTLSTLRYASRAKKIQNKAIVNQSDVDKLIRLLRQQNQRLRQMLAQATKNKTAVNEQMIANFKLTKNMLDYATQDNVEQDQSLLDNIKDYSNDNQETSTLNQSYSFIPLERNVDQNLPYLTNIGQDQLLSFRIKYSCQRLLIGNKNGVPKPDMVLSSLGIQPHHALISYNSQTKKCYIQALEQGAMNYTFLNGQPVKQKQEIVNLDRIVLGTGSAFILMFKDSQPRNKQLALADIDFQYVMSQLQNYALQSSKSSIQEQQIRRKTVSQIQMDYQKIKKDNQQQMKKQIQQKEIAYKQKIIQLQAQKAKQAEKLQQQLQVQRMQSQRMLQQKIKIRDEVQRIVAQSKIRQVKQQADKKQLQQTKGALQLKQKQIQQLYLSLNQMKFKTQQKSLQRSQAIKQQQAQMKKDLQMQTIICHNANIIAQYKLQLNKRLKNAKQVKELLVRKEKIELNKQLVELVPQIQRFNLMAKEMHKRIQAGLSIQYRYLSQAQIIQVIKNNSYKSKLKILIHVINRDQGRAYYWDTSIFKNRFQLALQCFDNYLKLGNRFNLRKEQDPYWDPQTFQNIAQSHLALQFIMFNISFRGIIPIISKGKRIGHIKISLYQTDQTGLQDISIDQKGQNGKYKLINPHQQIDRIINFVIEIGEIQINTGELEDVQSIRINYQMMQNYKMVKYQIGPINRLYLGAFQYRKVHVIKQLSQHIISHFMEKPIIFNWQAILKVKSTDQLTSRSGVTQQIHSKAKSSFAIQLQQQKSQLNSVQITQFQQISPPKSKQDKRDSSGTRVIRFETSSNKKGEDKGGVLFENTAIMGKVDQQYSRHKEQQVNMKKKKSMSKSFGDNKESPDRKKEKECQIY